jgi:hypothetical protein
MNQSHEALSLPTLLKLFTGCSSGNSYSIEDGPRFSQVTHVAGFWTWVVYVDGRAAAGERPSPSLETACRDAIAALRKLTRER